MADVQPGDVVLTKAKMILGNEKVMNTFHWEHTGVSAVTIPNFIAACNVLLEDMYNDVNASWTTQLYSDTIEHYNVTQDLPMDERAWPGGWAGLDAGDGLPYQNAALITFPAEGKRSIGKKYLPGSTEANNSSGGVLRASYITALESWAQKLLLGFISGANQFIPGNYRPLTAEFLPYLSAIIEAIYSTQRRRKPGTGI